MRKRALPQGIVGVGLSVFVVASLVGISAFQLPGEAVRVDNDDLGGVVSGPRGPEAGVWVIAETTDLPTKFARIVVTDDRGRYVVPDLPKATYNVWVRGYGLVDSPKVQAGPGKAAEPDGRGGAECARGGGILSGQTTGIRLLRCRPRASSPVQAPKGNGIAETMRSQADWLNEMRCGACHQIGTKATREIPKSLGTFHSSVAAWERRLQSGQIGANMSATLTRFGKERGLAMYADWSDRIAAGEVPPSPAPAARRGAKRGREPVGLVQLQGICPRHDLDRQAQSDRQRQRSRLQHFAVQPA